MGYSLAPVAFTNIVVTDAFWQPRLTTNRRITLPYCFRKCEETGRIANFDRAAGRRDGAHEGIFYNDSDVFKILEGAAYTLALVADPELDAYVDDLVARIEAAQEADGYLYTARTINPTAVSAAVEGLTRWSNLAVNHELYNVGHLYEAAVAHYQATGKRALLDIALRNAELIARVFGPDGLHDVPGHQEIELGLVKLYQVTGETKYLDLAHFFLDQRGRHDRRQPVVRFDNPGYLQDHAPVPEQAEAVGHAVRAGYMYAGMVDVAMLRDEPAWLAAVDRLWDDVVSHKLYLHGGIGARHEGEAFGDAFELPNATAYAETCAAIANVYWNHRMFLRQGQAMYMDVLELALYNCVLAGIAYDGATFFYPNPLASDAQWAFNKGSRRRQAWFDCSCCPSNLVRCLPALPGWIYATGDRCLYVCLYIGSQAVCTVPGISDEVRIAQETDYPWDGAVRLTLELARPARFTLALRVPGWLSAPVPGNLYAYPDAPDTTWHVHVNNQALLSPTVAEGWLRLERTWMPGDVVSLVWPMPIRQVQCRPEVTANRGRLALMRGPIVYCAEQVDNTIPVSALTLSPQSQLQTIQAADLPGEALAITAVHGTSRATLIPYHLWAHRQPGAMAVWLQSEGT